MRVERLFETTALTPVSMTLDRGGSDATTGALEATRGIRAASSRATARVSAAQDRQTAALARRGEGLRQLGETAAAAGGALGRLGLEIQEERNEAARETALANARTRGFQAADTAYREAREGAAPDGSDIESRFQDRVTKAHDTLLEEIEDPRVRHAASVQLTELRGRYTLTAREQAERQGRDFNRDQLDLRIVDMTTRAVNQRGAEQALALTILEDDINRQEELGTISKAQAAAKLAAARVQVSKGTVNIDAARDPALAQRRLMAGDYDHLFANDAERIGAALLIDRALEQRRGQELARLDGLVRDDLASRAANGRGVPGLERRIAALGDAAALAEYRERRALADRQYAMGEQIRWAAPAQAVGAVEAQRPQPGSAGFADRQKLYEAGRKALEQRNQALADDPAGYAAQHPRLAALAASGADTATVRNERIALQQSLGVAQPAWFSKAEAAQVVQQFDQASADDKIRLLAQVQGEAGRHGHLAQADLIDAGLPAEATVLTMHAGDPRMVAVLGRTMTALGAGADLKAAVPSEDRTVLKAAVSEELEEFNRTEMARATINEHAAQMVATVQRTVEALALSYAAGGMEPAQAAEQAANELINGHFDMRRTFRVPAGVDGDRVEYAAENMQRVMLETFVPRESFMAAVGAPDRLEATGQPVGRRADGGIGFDDPALQAQLERETDTHYENWLASIDAFGQWINTADGLGVFLVDGEGNTVVNAAGERFELRFDDLPVLPARGSQSDLARGRARVERAAGRIERQYRADGQ